MLSRDGREHAGQHRLDVVEHVVDHGVVPDLDVALRGELARLRPRADIEADDDRLRCRSQGHVGLVDPANPGMEHANPDLVGGKALRIGLNGLDRALDIGLDDQRELLLLLAADIGEHLLHGPARGPRGPCVALAANAELGDLAGAGFVLDHAELIARGGRSVETEDFHRHRGAGRTDRRAGVVDDRPHPSPFAARDHDIAGLEGASLDQQRRHRAPAPLQLGFDHHTIRGALRVRPELEDFGLEDDGLEQLVEIGALDRGDVDGQHVAAELLDHQLVLQQLVAHARGIGVGPIHLVHRDDNRHLGGPCVVDGLDGLRHHPVIRGDHQDHDVGDVGAPGAHRGKRRMSRGVDEGDLLVAGGKGHLIGAYVLRDPAGLAGHHVGFAQRVEQRRLAVIDMPHDRDHGRARIELGVGIVHTPDSNLDIGVADALDVVAVFGDHQLRRIGVDRLVDGRHDAHAHQRLDDVGGALRHPARELLYGDGLGDHDIAHDLGDGLVGTPLGPLFALAEPPERRQAALALLVVQRLGDGQTPGAPPLLSALGREAAGLRPAGPAPARPFGLALFRLGVGFSCPGAGSGFLRGLGLGGVACRGGLFGRRFRGRLRRVLFLQSAGLGLDTLALGLFLFPPPPFFLRGLLERPARLVGRMLFGLGLLQPDQGAGAGGSLLLGQLARRGSLPILGGRDDGGRRDRFRGGLRRDRLDLGRGRLDFGHVAIGGLGESPLAAHLDRDRLGAAVREALPDLSGVDRFLEFQPARPRQAELLLRGLLFCLLSHIVQLSCAARNPARRAASVQTRTSSPPGLNAA